MEPGLDRAAGRVTAMTRARRLISFDWAMKRLLRSKAHFGILEGFLSELLREDIRILEILESESNKDTAVEKQNRVDLKARNAGGEIILIEVQYPAAVRLFAADSAQHGADGGGESPRRSTLRRGGEGHLGEYSVFRPGPGPGLRLSRGNPIHRPASA